jgi:hypothetical protein
MGVLSATAPYLAKASPSSDLEWNFKFETGQMALKKFTI